MWEVPVKEYRRYKEMKFDVEIPKKDPGAYIVTVSSGRIEATTVVVVSDLAMIARAGRKGAAVMVENMKTGERVANPAVSTAADGKALKAWTKETAASRLSFMAEAPGGIAFRDMDVSRMPVPPVREAMALVMADRESYGPEDEVKLRVVVRDVQEGAWVLPREKRYRLRARSHEGVFFFDTDLDLSRWGTGAVSFRLPPGISGRFWISVFEKAKTQEKMVGGLAMQVSVNAARSSRIEFLSEDKPVFAGDPVEVTGVLRDAWGRPMPGRKVEVLMPGGLEWKELRTGADGTFPVPARETDRYAGDGMAKISARAGGVEGTFVVPVLSRSVDLAFEASSRLHEPLPAGDARTVAFSARRGDDTPVSRPFRWKVVRTNEAGERSLTASGEVTTGPEGKASFAFTPREAGAHVVTVLMKDEDGMPNRLRGSIAVFDEKEEAKLRILSGADEFDPGKPFEVQVISRFEKGLAFVTVESEAIEQVLPVTLEKGRTTVRLGPPPAATRDFSVSVMMMQGNVFHSETRDFRLKPPEMKVEPSKKEYRPGEEASVTVTAPPGSEVVLVASDRLRMALPGDSFLPARNGRYFGVESSAALAFVGQTTEVDAQVFAALERWSALETNRGVRVMMPKEEPVALDLVGTGGGGGGRYGSRLGGKRSLWARGGGGSDTGKGKPLPLAEPAPLFVGSAVATEGKATFSFRLPWERGRYVVAAWAVDGSNEIVTKSEEIKVNAPVTAEVRAPESAVEGEKTSVVALLTNHSKQDQEVTLSFGRDVKVRVPARSTVEKAFDWIAAPSAVFAMDGLRQDLKVEMRLPGPSVMAEAGGAFAAKTELAPEGPGKVAVRYAVGPASLLESLAEGRDSLTPASDAAARLIAWMARHRHARTEAAKRVVMEYQARRAAGLKDAAEEDAAWPVLLYLAEAEAKAAEFDVKPDGALLKQRFAQAASDDVKAVMLFALARGGEAEYGSVHRLWRAADTLSPRALASVALALQAAKKPDEAKAAVARLVKAAREDHWDIVEAGMPDASNTPYGATALAAFAIAEIDPANPLLARTRAWLLSRAPSTPFERALLALAMQSTGDKSAVTGLRIGGQAVTGFGEVWVDKASIEPVGEGTYYVLARRPTGKAPESPVKAEVKRTNRWPALVVEGVVAAHDAVEGGTPAEQPSMEKVAAGEVFSIDFEIKVTGPTKQYRVLEFPRTTGLRVVAGDLRVLLPPQEEGEQKHYSTVTVYSDLTGAYPGMTVLPAGTDYRAGWSMSPGERLGAGRIRFDRKQWREARETLAPLFEKGPLVEAAAIEAARMLAYSAAELKEHETVVRFFEILKEKSPAEVVSFERIRAVGRAYAAVNEHERAMQVHSGTCDAYFLQEANVVGALEGLGRSRQAVAEMNRLISEYPDTPLNREMLYGLAVKLYWAAKEAPLAADKDGKRLTRGETLKECVAALERTLAGFPLHPDADRAALTLGSAHLEAGNHAAAERAARAAAGRYPKSQHQDGFDYTTAFACFGQRRFDEALVLCDRLETFDYGARGDRGPGVMRDRAVLMKAQIFHAKGDLEKALENYKKLKASSPDAARSVAFLEKEAISVPEATTVPLAKPAEIELEYSGVKSAQVRAYKVDLTALMLRRKGNVTASSIEVAGIRPVLDKAFALDAPNTRRRERQKLALDLKDPGAYVVNVKAGDFFASGLLLRSDLSMAVQEDGDGTVRVNVSNVAANAFAEGVKVTIFGTADPRILSDKTDLRGIWEASAVHGMAVVVAEKDGHVAMYRGQAASPLQVQRAAQIMVPAKPQAPVDALQDQLKDLNKEAESLYQGNVERQQEGVEVERTKKK